MVLSKKLVSTGLTAALLASLLATAASTSVFAVGSAIPIPVVAPNNGSDVALPFIVLNVGAAGDIVTASGLVVTAPSGYAFTAGVTGSATPSVAGILAASGTAAVTGTITSTTVRTFASITNTAIGTVTISGLSLHASGVAAGNVIAGSSGGTLGSVTLYTLTVAPFGTGVTFFASAKSVPADGVSTIVLTFNGYATTTNNVMISTTNGRFTSTSAGSGFVIGIAQTSATVTNPINLAVGGTLTVTAPNAAGTATVTVWLTPVIGGSATLDSSTVFTFTVKDNHEGDDHGGRDQDRGNGNGHGARKVGFFDNPTFTCATGATPISGAKTFGFAILNTTGHKNKMLNVNVVLKGALPNVSYDVWVNQVLGGCPLTTPTKVGAVHTNRHGNGTAHLRVALVSGATHFWVSATSGASVLRTGAASFKIKH